MPKEPIANLVFEEVLTRLRSIREGEKYWCSPFVYDSKTLPERDRMPAIVVYQSDDEWSVEAMGNVKIDVSQQIIICMFHLTPQAINRLRADVEKALLVGSGYLLKKSADYPAVTYSLAAPSMTVANEGMELGDAQFVLKAFYQREHGEP